MPQSTLEEFVGSMTLSELAQRSGKSVSQIIEWAGSKARPAKAAPARAAAAAAPAKKPSGRGSKNVNTRTPEGRAAYDEAVFEAVSGAKDAVGSAYLRKRIGGTPLQLRTALNRLIESGKVTYQGKARATRYSLR